MLFVTGFQPQRKPLLQTPTAGDYNEEHRISKLTQNSRLLPKSFGGNPLPLLFLSADHFINSQEIIPVPFPVHFRPVDVSCPVLKGLNLANDHQNENNQQQEKKQTVKTELTFFIKKPKPEQGQKSHRRINEIAFPVRN